MSAAGSRKDRAQVDPQAFDQTAEERQPVRVIKTPIRLEYTVTAGRELSEFLKGLMQKRILGRRSLTGKVYVPPRGGCPITGLPTVETVEVAQIGTVTTFCIINIPFQGQRLEPPYVCAAIVLDGADTTLFHLVGNCDVANVRMGMRVRAVWVADDDLAPTLESIQFFEPTDEADAPYDSYKEHL